MNACLLLSRRGAIALSLALTVGALAGCGQAASELPLACRAAPTNVRAALGVAPAAVRLGKTPISGCFVRGADTADVQQVGAMVLGAASPLARAARDDPEGDDALRLGYLVGAVHRGIDRKQGIYAELERRLELELADVDENAAAFRRGRRAAARDG